MTLKYNIAQHITLRYKSVKSLDTDKENAHALQRQLVG